jgi:hypothetical protein
MIDVGHQDLGYTRFGSFPDGVGLIRFKLLGVNVGVGIYIL